jgi:hypothetical protein
MTMPDPNPIHPKLKSIIDQAKARVRDAEDAVAYYDDYAATLMAVPRQRLREARDNLEAIGRQAEAMPYGVRLLADASRVEPSRWCRSRCGAKDVLWTNRALDGKQWYWFANAQDAMLFKLTFGAAG